MDAYFPMGLFYGRHNLDGTDTSEDDTSEGGINDESYGYLRKYVFAVVGVSINAILSCQV